MAFNGYLRNAWYVAAWSSEITRGLFERTILEQSILMYRKENGDIAAIGNACPHRLAPLHMGKLVGDTIQCGYHGLRFDGSGACVLNPHADGMIPPKMKVPAYPLVEKHGLVWLWFGDEDKADPATIPDFSCHLDPELAFVGGVIEMKANYELITDNLLDLAHSEFVHEGLLSSAGYTASKLQTIEKGTTIYANRWAPGCDAMPAFHMIFEGHKQGDPVDHWAYMRWDAPAHMLLDVGITHPGRPRTEGAWIYGTDILTPRDRFNTYYFWGIHAGVQAERRGCRRAVAAGHQGRALAGRRASRDVRQRCRRAARAQAARTADRQGHRARSAERGSARTAPCERAHERADPPGGMTR